MLRRFGPLVVLTCVSAAVVLLAGCGRALPNVAGQSLEAATAEIAALGMTVGDVTVDPTSPESPGTVTAQRPAAGKRVNAGTAIALTVAGCLVPSVVGFDQERAQQDLMMAGVAVGALTQQYDSSQPSGTVISQSAVPGTYAAQGTPVALVVSAGEAPLAVPDVRGLTAEQATVRLTAAGFRVAVKTVNDAAGQGMVVAQEPLALEAARESTVTLSVSSGVELVAVPSCVGQLVMAARGNIEAAGLVYRDVIASGRPSDATLHGKPVDMGVVYSQSPESGKKVPRGTVVKISWWR